MADYDFLSCKSQNKTDKANIKADTTSAKQQPVWSNAYGSADTAYDTQFLRIRNQVAPKFKTLEFADKQTGKTMTYNLYVPNHYDKCKSSRSFFLWQMTVRLEKVRKRL